MTHLGFALLEIQSRPTVLKPSDIRFNRQEIQSPSVNCRGYPIAHSWSGIPPFPDSTLIYIMPDGQRSAMLCQHPMGLQSKICVPTVLYPLGVTVLNGA
jgi:hypothetical protein